MICETKLVMVSSAGTHGVAKDILALLDGKLSKLRCASTSCRIV